MNKIPQDPIICLSFINTQLRDFYTSLEELCLVFGTDQKQLEEKLEAVGYYYDEGRNQFC